MIRLFQRSISRLGAHGRSVERQTQSPRELSNTQEEPTHFQAITKGWRRNSTNLAGLKPNYRNCLSTPSTLAGSRFAAIDRITCPLHQGRGDRTPGRTREIKALQQSQKGYPALFKPDGTIPLFTSSPSSHSTARWVGKQSDCPIFARLGGKFDWWVNIPSLSAQP